MKSEETKLINPEAAEKKQDTAQPVQEPQITTSDPKKKKSTAATHAAYGAGGFVAGSAATFASQAAAQAAAQSEPEAASHVTSQETSQETSPEVSAETHATTSNASAQPYAAPNQEDVILATDEGIRVAQVDDSQSFSQAFADARAQVGPGGVFEWHGKVYGTYYKEEWEQMSGDERQAYQAKIDYQDVTSGTHDTADNNTMEPVTATAHTTNGSMESAYEATDNFENENEVKVLGVEEIYDENGNPMTVAATEMEGHEVLLVDVDHDGTVDVIMSDVNGDGQISADEIADVSDAGIHVSDLQQNMAANEEGMLLAHHDGLPDYMPDADVHTYLA